MNSRDGQLGFTIVEVVFALVGIVAVTAVVVATLSSSTTFVGVSMGTMASQSAIRNAVDVMAAEIQWADKKTVIISTFNGSAKIDFKIPRQVVNGAAQLSSTITYRVEPSTLDANANGIQDEGMIVRVQDGRTRVICQRIKNAGLTLTLADDQLTLQLRAMAPDGHGGALDYLASTTIQLKNGG